MPIIPLPINRVYLSHQISEPAFDASGGNLFYVRTADGRRSIVRQCLQSGLAQTVTTEPAPHGGVGYGSALYALNERVLVYAAKDRRLHAVNLSSGEQWPATPAYEGVAAPAISPCGRFVAFLCEQDGRCNVLLAGVRGSALPVKLSDDPWFAFNPTFSPDGARIAWQEWDREHMPWEVSRLKIGSFAKPTHLCQDGYELLPLSLSTVARDSASLGSPQFSPDGARLAYTSDETGWRSLWVAAGDGTQARRVDTGEGEIGRADWVPGLIAMRWGGDSGSLYAVRRHESRDVLLQIDLSGGAAREIPMEWTKIDGLNGRGGSLAFVASNPWAPPRLLTLAAGEPAAVARATDGVGLTDSDSLVRPEVVRWYSGAGARVWGILYRASDGAARRRPTIVYVHGGPTHEEMLAWDPQAQYFATRGWNYLLVNYRGSTGFGRAYQDLLRGNWGVVDVDDARSGAEFLVEAGLADGDRLVIAGASAGGYTTLMSLARHPDFWSAGISVFGIGQLYELKDATHRFEAGYEDFLLGRLPEQGAVWKERSPLTHVDRVRAPVLLFHGTEDRAVPMQQSVDFAEAVRRRGGIAELVTCEGEGHGFKKESTRRDVLEKMEKFLDRYVVCLQK